MPGTGFWLSWKAGLQPPALPGLAAGPREERRPRRGGRWRRRAPRQEAGVGGGSSPSPSTRREQRGLGPHQQIAHGSTQKLRFN